MFKRGIGPGYISFVECTNSIGLDCTATDFDAKHKMETHGEVIYTFDTKENRDAFEGFIQAQGWKLANEIKE